MYWCFFFALILGLFFAPKSISLHDACGIYQRGIQITVPDKWSYLLDSSFHHARLVQRVPHPQTSIYVKTFVCDKCMYAIRPNGQFAKMEYENFFCRLPTDNYWFVNEKRTIIVLPFEFENLSVVILVAKEFVNTMFQ